MICTKITISTKIYQGATEYEVSSIPRILVLEIQCPQYFGDKRTATDIQTDIFKNGQIVFRISQNNVNPSKTGCRKFS